MADETAYIVHGMDCASCARELEDGVARLDGVSAVRVDFATGKMRVSGDVPFDTLRQRAEALGKRIEPAAEAAASPAAREALRGGAAGFALYLLARRETRLALASGAVIVLTLLLSVLAALPAGLAAALYTAAMAVAAYPIARSGLNTLRINRTFSINLLMTIAAVGAVIIGEHLEAATVIFLFAIGEALEGFTADRARDSLRGLLDLAPAQAVRLRPEGGQEAVPVALLRVGDLIAVNPGERVPMDGVVTAGSSGVNQAPITGESMPVYKEPGAQVYAGTLNGDGALEVRVTHLAADNTLSRIIRLVEEAQGSRAPSQRLVDRFAHYYTPGVVLLALLVALVPPLLFNAPFYDTPDGAHGWLYRALTLLVIACPCALVISTPVTIISAITAAARRGVLIKGGAHLEALGQVRAAAFDKTGTLTAGSPVVTQVRSLECGDSDPCPACDNLLALAASVEQRSTHPLARAVVDAASARGVDAVFGPAEGVAALAGRGITGQVGGHTVTLGSHTLFEADFPHDTALCALVDSAEAHGQTAMLLAQDDQVHGFIAAADQVRPASPAVIAALRSLGLHTVMLTGDNAAVAQAVGAQVGVDAVRAGLLPDQKVDAIRGLLREYGSVVMVGDGINDTPALAAATVGVAMGGAGSAQALETADIVLMADDLAQLPYAVRLARFTRRLIAQNIGLSIGLKLVFMALALAGGATMWLAVLADVGMSLAVTLNGMRPLRRR